MPLRYFNTFTNQEDSATILLFGSSQNCFCSDRSAHYSSLYQSDYKSWWVKNVDNTPQTFEWPRAHFIFKSSLLLQLRQDLNALKIIGFYVGRRQCFKNMSIIWRDKCLKNDLFCSKQDNLIPSPLLPAVSRKRTREN